MDNMNAQLMRLAILLFFACTTFSVHAQERVYVTDTYGNVVKSGTGLCWRTGYWTPEAVAKDPAGCECDGDFLTKETCNKNITSTQTKRFIGTCMDCDPQMRGDKFNKSVYFEHKRRNLKPSELRKLEDLSEGIKDFVRRWNGKLELILLEGNIDDTESSPHQNYKLSEQRALAVKSQLVKLGIDHARIYIDDRGNRAPTSHTEKCHINSRRNPSRSVIECLRPNRRVDIQAIGYGKN